MDKITIRKKLKEAHIPYTEIYDEFIVEAQTSEQKEAFRKFMDELIVDLKNPYQTKINLWTK
jgi:hypothetical protein